MLQDVTIIYNNVNIIDFNIIFYYNINKLKNKGGEK